MNKKLDPELTEKLDALRDLPARDPRLAARGRAVFLSQAVDAQNEAVSTASKGRLNKWLKESRQIKEKKTMTTFASILAVLMLALGGGAGTVYAAQDALPNDTLYELKLFSEEMRLNMAADTTEQFALAFEFAQRRSDEIQALIAEGAEPNAENMLMLVQQTQTAVQLAGTLDGEAQLLVRNMIQNQMQQMQNLQANASSEGAMLMEQTRTALRLQWTQAGGTEEPVQTQTQQGMPEETPGQGSPNEEPGQGAGNGNGEPAQGTADGEAGQGSGTPGAGNSNGQQNQAEDPCAAYYASLAQAGGQGQAGGGNGNGQGGAQSTGQGPVVYGTNGEVCPTPTALP